MDMLNADELRKYDIRTKKAVLKKRRHGIVALHANQHAEAVSVWTRSDKELEQQREREFDNHIRQLLTDAANEYIAVQEPHLFPLSMKQ
jgi:hypothetical protein